MNVQTLFFDCLNRQKALSPDGAQKMPLVCIAGYKDFDLLRASTEQVIIDEFTAFEAPEEAKQKVGVPPPLETGSQFVPTKGPPFDPPGTDPTEKFVAFPPTPDPLQAASQIEWFNFCGANVFRALAMETGFVFA